MRLRISFDSGSRTTGYVLDGKVRPFTIEKQVIGIRQPDESLREEPLTIRHSVHGPVMIEQDGVTKFQTAMRELQLPLFNTTYAGRDGRILYLFNAALPPGGFVHNCNDPPWTSAFPMLLDPARRQPPASPRA